MIERLIAEDDEMISNLVKVNLTISLNLLLTKEET